MKKYIIFFVAMFLAGILYGYTNCTVTPSCTPDCQAAKQTCLDYCRSNHLTGLENAECRQYCANLGQTCVECDDLP